MSFKFGFPGVSKNIKISAGVRLVDGKFIFNFDDDGKGDIISLAEIALKESSIFHHTYFYGYEFLSDVPSKIRTEFINQIKNLEEPTFDKENLERFLINPIREFGKKLHKMDCIVYPVSQRTNINQAIVHYIYKFALVSSENYLKLEMIKNADDKIEFDFNLFEINHSHKRQYPEMRKAAEHFIKGIKSNTGYFSLANDVPPKYRSCMRNCLIFQDDADSLISKLDKKNILIVDDINTTQNTLQKVLRVIHKMAMPKKVIILTMLGKSYNKLV